MEHYHNDTDGLALKLRLNVFAIEHSEVFRILAVDDKPS
jgi:hypothetical protein